MIVDMVELYALQYKYKVMHGGVMFTTTATIKGQVTIPVGLRKKLKIHRGTRLQVKECNGKIIMEPLPDDLLAVGRGMLKTKGKALRRLLLDRQFEAER